MHAQKLELEHRLDDVRMSESDRRAAKAQMRQAEAMIDFAIRVAAAIRSAVPLPWRLKQPSPRAR
jgi:hypothetical protein